MRRSLTDKETRPSYEARVGPGVLTLGVRLAKIAPHKTNLYYEVHGKQKKDSQIYPSDNAKRSE
jgi:hypothetical protein